MRARPLFRLALAGVTALVLLAAAHPHPAQAATAPNPFVGLVSEDAFGGTDVYRGAVLSRMSSIGVGTVRQTLDWSLAEPRKGHYEWSRFDAWVGATAQVGIRVLPILFNPPAWASSKPKRRAKRGTYPPRHMADFARFAKQAVGRYGPNGAYWRAHPAIPAQPIGSWQVWNEPNLPVYWQPKPRASKYVAMLKAVSRSIKKVDRTAQVLTGGLPKSKLGIPLTTFVRQIYKAGGKKWFDALAINPYSKSPGGVLGFLRQIRKIMNSRGDRSANLWATEIGWSDRGPGGQFKLGTKGQARAIKSVVPKLWKARASLRLQGVIYFNWRDAKPYPGGKDFWGLHTGLLSIANQPKPAFTSFGSAVALLK